MPNWKKLLTSGSDASLNSLTVDAGIQAVSLTGSLSYNDLTNVPTLVSGSGQITLSSTNGFSSFSSSIDTHLDTNILALSASVDTHLDANISNLSSSAHNQRVSLLSSLSSSVDTHLDANIAAVNSNITSISSSVDSRILTEKGRIDAILLSADADKDSFAEIVSLINSVDTTNDNAFASFYTASTGRLSSLESYTSSLQSTSLVSGSSQIDITNTTGYTVFSSSIDTHLDSNITALSSSAHTQRVALDSLQTTANSNLSSSAHTQRLALISALSASVDTHLDANISALSSSVDTHLDANITALSSSAHTQRVALVQPINTSISNLNTFSSSLQITQYNFTGSFSGDGSGLTGVNVNLTETTTVLDTFTNQTSVSVPHNFGTKNVIVSVYDSNDAQILPDSVVTTDTNTVTVGFCESTSGRVIVAKGGHLVSGSIELFTHREAISGSNSYTVTHNLNEDYPIVQVYDSNKQQVLPQTITSTNNNTIAVTFCENLTGTIVIKK